MKKLITLILALILCQGIISCKKNSAATHPPDTFFKVYNEPVAKQSITTRTTTYSSGSMAVDNNGNIYVFYQDSLISGYPRLAIIKTDKNGEKIWNVSYLPFNPVRIDVDLNNNNNTWPDFLCIGQSLFIAGADSSGNRKVLRINCSGGKMTNQFSLEQIAPSTRSFFQLVGMWPTIEGNLLVGAWSSSVGGFQTPVLNLLDQSGNLIWANNNFPCPVPDSSNFHEHPYCLLELTNGNFIYGTVGMYGFSDNNGNSLVSSTLYFRQLSSSGNLIRTDSLAQGVYNSSGDPTFINSNGAAQSFSLFTSPLGGYIIVSLETYDYYQDARVKILKTDPSFHVQDSSYVSLGCSVVTSAVQNKEGEIIMSVFNQVLPVTNIICNLYKIEPNGSVTTQNQIGLPTQSVFISGMSLTNDDHILMDGLIQFANVDTNNLFILKTDKDGHFN